MPPPTRHLFDLILNDIVAMPRLADPMLQMCKLRKLKNESQSIRPVDAVSDSQTLTSAKSSAPPCKQATIQCKQEVNFAIKGSKLATTNKLFNMKFAVLALLAVFVVAAVAE